MSIGHDYRLALARHFRAMGGWLTAGYFNSTSADETAARDAMVADGHVTAAKRDRINTYELTDAGAAWLEASSSSPGDFPVRPAHVGRTDGHPASSTK